MTRENENAVRAGVEAGLGTEEEVRQIIVALEATAERRDNMTREERVRERKNSWWERSGKFGPRGDGRP